MKQLIVGFYAVPALLVIGASVVLMEKSAVILCGVLAYAVIVVIACALLEFARSKKQPLWHVVFGAIICLALITSVVTVHWPLRLAYFFSRPSLDRLAEKVRRGQPFVGPARVGMFTIVQAEVTWNGIVCLWVDPNPRGKTGFVQCEQVKFPFGLWSELRLDDRWQFISED